MRVLVTGGAGFIGRWTVARLIQEGHEVHVLDNLSNGSRANLADFEGHKGFLGFTHGDVADEATVDKAFDARYDACIHAAAQIEVQQSLDKPALSFRSNILGTYHVMEAARRTDTKVALLGTCMVYDTASGKPITEDSPVKPASPYAGSKLAAEEWALSYHLSYGLPVTILRPFNTYGPYQKSNMEGGVVPIFVKRDLDGQTLRIFGDGTQTRDLLYAEDCARFIVQATFSPKAEGQVINAGTGRDIAIKDLALLVCKDPRRIEHVPHHHPQSEIPRLVCDASKAKRLLGWAPQVTLEEGIQRTRAFLRA